MATVKLTSKRQATFPKELCQALGLVPGDRINVEKRTVQGEEVWLLRTKKALPPWFGVFKKYVRGRSPRMEDIRASIGKGLAKTMREGRWANKRSIVEHGRPGRGIAAR